MKAEHPDPPSLPGALRVLRRRADLSQRELAARSGVPSTTVGDVESGRSPNPGFQTVERLVAATGARLAIVDLDGSEPAQLATDGWHDRAGRRFPAHLDPRRASWRGARPIDGFEFIRNRQRRDFARQVRAGERLGDATVHVRRLGAGDASVLAALRAEAHQLHPGGRAVTALPSLPDDEALRYLRDPTVRHWVAEERGMLHAHARGQVLGHLVARVHYRHAGPPVMVVTDIGVRPAHPDGRVGIMLVAALSDDAVLLNVPDVVAMPGDRAVARFLHELGFRRRPRRPPLLTLG